MSTDARWLVAGPRGRRLCYEVVCSSWSQLPSSWCDVLVGGPVDPELAAHQLILDESVLVSAQLMNESLDRSVSAAMYWQPPDVIDHALAHPALCDALERIALQLLPIVPEWWYRSMPIPQFEVMFGTELQNHPDESVHSWYESEISEEESAGSREGDWSGRWWSAPCWPRLVRGSGAVDGVGPTVIWLYEDFFSFSQVLITDITVPATARVCEIASATQWSELVVQYPFEVTNSRRCVWRRTTGREGRWLIPDYAALAEHYDAVHVSVRAYLETAGRVLETGDGTATMLAGWDPDLTYWLTDAATLGVPQLCDRDACGEI